MSSLPKSARAARADRYAGSGAAGLGRPASGDSVRPLRSPWLLAAFAAACSGCASHSGPPPRGARGSVDVVRLARLDPAYRTVGDYDRAIAELRGAIQATGAPAPAGDQVAALPPLALPEAARRPVGIAGLQRRLEDSKRRELDSLAALRLDARRRQIRRESVEIARTAQADYGRRVAAIEQDYRAAVARVAGDQETRRINLVIQIKALKETLARYPATPLPAASGEPPMPGVAGAREALAEKVAELASIDSDLKMRLASVAGNRDERLAAAEDDRRRQIDAALAERERDLAAADRRQIEREGYELDRQIRTLVRQAMSLASSTVSPAGSVGPVTVVAKGLPPAAAAAPSRSIADLQRERDRWLGYLYDEARTAAQDAAEQKGWTISFRPAGPGSADLTGAIAQELRATVWRS